MRQEKPSHDVSRLHPDHLRSGFKRVLATSAVNGVLLLISIATGVITARTLGPDGRGALAAIVLGPELLAAAFSMGLPAAAIYWIKREEESAGATLGAVLILGAALGVVLAIFGALAASTFLASYGSDVVRQAQWAMAATPVLLLLYITGAALRALDRFTAFNLAHLLQYGAALAALALAAATSTLSVGVAAAIYLGAALPSLVYSFAASARRVRPSFRAIGARVRQLAHYGLRASGVELANVLAFEFPRVLMVGLLEPAAMGLFIVARSLATPLFFLGNAIVAVVLPLSASSDEQAFQSAAIATPLSVAVSVAMGALLFWLGPALLILFYGEAFSESAPVFRFLLIDAVVALPASVAGQAFLATGRPGALAVVRLLTVGAGVALAGALFAAHGLEGAAAGFAAASVLGLGLTLIGYPLLLRRKPPRLIPLPGDVRRLLGRDAQSARSR